jgi:hypothetical protein
MVVLHTCGNRLCVNVGHLTLDTFSDTGGRQRETVLTPDQVEEIRQRYAAGGISQRKLAAADGVTAMAVNRIVNGRTYRPVP